MAGGPPAGAAISLRQTLAGSKWRGEICPRCGNTLDEGAQVVLCPKCYTPHHATCWQENDNKCAVDETPARIIIRPGQQMAAPSAQPAAAAREIPPDIQAPATPAQPTPSADTDPAAQGRPGTAAYSPAAGAVRPEAAGATAAGGAGGASAPRPPAPPRPVPGAAGGRAPGGRAPARPVVREAPGLQTMATVRERLEAALSDLDPEFGTSVDEVSVTVPADRVQEAARRAKEHEQLRMDYIRCLSAVDYQDEGIEVVYHLFSTSMLQKFVLKARVPAEGHGLPSVTPVWAGADWHEREAAEMFNIRFDGHPHLEPLLLQKDEAGRIVPGPILLKRFPLRPKEPPGIYGFPEEE